MRNAGILLAACMLLSSGFTAAAILLLNQVGKLHLTDLIRKWLPQLPASDAAITIGNLLDHTSGLAN